MTTPMASVLVGLSECSRAPLCIVVSKQGLLFFTRKIYKMRFLFKTLKQPCPLLSQVDVFHEAWYHFQTSVGALLQF